MADEQEWPRRRDQLGNLADWDGNDLRKEIEHVVRNGVQVAVARFLSRQEIEHLVAEAEKRIDQRSAQRWRTYTGHSVGTNPFEPSPSDDQLRDKFRTALDPRNQARLEYVDGLIDDVARGKQREERIRSWLTVAAALGGGGLVSWLIAHVKL